MATTAVSFRKGNTEENNNFAGVQGEIVADLGANEQVTEKATIVLHTGNGVAGGIPMARADLNNITNESISNLANFKQGSGLGTYYGLMRRNLSNYITNDVNAATVGAALKKDYHLASQNGIDIDTSTYIAGRDGNQDPLERSAGGKYLLNKDLSNLHYSGENVVRKLSYKYWLNSINTSFLAEGNYTYDGETFNPHGSYLAYATMDNVNTEYLADHARQAGTTVGHLGKNLAYYDLSNVGYSTIVTYLHNAYLNGQKLQDYEWVENKIHVIDPLESGLTTKYPSAQAIVSYSATVGENYANRHLDNISSWEFASAKEDVYKVAIDISNPGTGYSVPTSFQTDIAHPDGGYVNIVVKRVSSAGAILEVSTDTGQEYSSAIIPAQPYSDSGTGGAAFVVHAIENTTYHDEVKAGKLMLANLSNSDITSTSFQNAAVKYQFTESNGEVVSIASVYGKLVDEDTQTSSSFAANNSASGTETKISTDNTQASTRSSIIVTKDNAYLNKSASIDNQGAGEARDLSHQLLNRGEMDARYQLQPASATTDNIATFNNALSTVDSGKAFTTSVANDTATASNNKVPTEKAVRDAIDVAITQAVVYKGTVDQEVADPTATPPKTGLPTSGQTNGDLWWIRAFSSNPPTGMTPGHAGTAIWNGSTSDWDYKEDTKNDPDDETIKLNNVGKLSVKLSPRSDNAIVKNTDGIYVSGNSFVSSEGYVAVNNNLAQHSYEILSNDGTNTYWRPATPEPPATQGIYHLVVDEYGVPSWVNDNRLELGPSTDDESGESGESGY